MSSTLNGTTVVASIQTGERVTQNTVATDVNFTDGAASGLVPGASLTNGTGANKAQHTWTNTITVNTSGTTLDLTALTGGLDGGTRNFSKIKGYKIENLDGTNKIDVGNAASNAWLGINDSTTQLSAIDPGGFIMKYMPSAAGIAVAGGNKSLLIASEAATCSCKITFVGEGT